MLDAVDSSFAEHLEQLKVIWRQRIHRVKSFDNVHRVEGHHTILNRLRQNLNNLFLWQRHVAISASHLRQHLRVHDVGVFQNLIVKVRLQCIGQIIRRCSVTQSQRIVLPVELLVLFSGRRCLATVSFFILSSVQHERFGILLGAANLTLVLFPRQRDLFDVAPFFERHISSARLSTIPFTTFSYNRTSIKNTSGSYHGPVKV